MTRKNNTKQHTSITFLLFCFLLVLTNNYAFFGMSKHRQRVAMQSPHAAKDDSDNLLASGTDAAPASATARAKRSLLIGGAGLLGAGAYSLQTQLLRAAAAGSSGLPVLGPDALMAKKAHGTSEQPVQSKLRWNCDVKLADRICNFNRNWAEFAGYWSSSETSFLREEDGSKGLIKFYDSVTGKLLFTAAARRSFEEWRDESMSHGWPSFRDDEVCLHSGCS